MNLRQNNLDGAVNIHPIAVSDCAGTLALYGGNTTGHSSVVASELTGHETEIVPSLDLFAALQRCGNQPIDLLKIDVEGSEVDILKPAALPALERVSRVVVEYHGRIRPGSRQIIFDALRKAGFRHIEDRPDLPDGQLGLLRAAR